MSRSNEATGYRTLLRLPGARRAFAAASIGRLSYGTLGLSLLYVVERASGSFGVAGLASGVLPVCVLSGPLKARFVDRHGQRHSIAGLGVAYAGALLGLAALAAEQVQDPVAYIALAGIAGLLAPPLGPAMRALWTVIAKDSTTRQRAYTLDVSVEDTLFMIGPLIVGGLVAVDGAILALAVTAGLVLVGSVALATSPVVAIHAGSTPKGVRMPISGPLHTPGFAVMVGIVLGASAGIGVIDVAVAARAVHDHDAAAGGYLLAALAAGSLAGGLIWGRRPRYRKTSTQLIALAIVLAIGLAAASRTAGLGALAVVLAITGSAQGSLLIISYLTADRLTPKSAKTETSTWVNTAFNGGAALGASIGGLVVEYGGASDAFLLGSLIVTATVVLTVTLGPRLNSHTTSTEHLPGAN